MNSQEIQDVLVVSRILDQFVSGPTTQFEVIAALIDWRDGSLGTVDPYPPVAAPEPVAAPKAKPAKAAPRKAPAKAAAVDEPEFEPSPDPSADDEPDF